jgi:hypothetical protein
MTSKTLSGLTARALVLGVAGAAFGAVGAGTAAAQEEAGPRLSGTFSMISRITEESGDFETPRGTERTDYRFVPRCSRGACDVTLVRESGRVRLERDGRRVYRGVFTRTLPCRGESTQLRQAFTVRVVESRGGIARRIEGTIKATLTGGVCTGESTRVFRGNRRAARSPRFTG